jgi:hypothetical protein
LIIGANPTVGAIKLTSAVNDTQPNCPKLLAEFIGSLALIFIGAAAVVGDGAGLNGIGSIAFARPDNHGLCIRLWEFVGRSF